MSKSISRREQALEHADLGMDSTRFSVEFVCIKRRVSEEVVAADWSTRLRRGWICCSSSRVSPAYFKARNS